MNSTHDTTSRHAPAGDVMKRRNHGPQGLKIVNCALVERGLCRPKPGLSLYAGHVGGARSTTDDACAIRHSYPISRSDT